MNEMYTQAEKELLAKADESLDRLDRLKKEVKSIPPLVSSDLFGNPIIIHPNLNEDGSPKIANPR